MRRKREWLRDRDRRAKMAGLLVASMCFTSLTPVSPVWADGSRIGRHPDSGWYAVWLERVTQSRIVCGPDMPEVPGISDASDRSDGSGAPDSQNVPAIPDSHGFPGNPRAGGDGMDQAVSGDGWDEDTSWAGLQEQDMDSPGFWVRDGGFACRIDVKARDGPPMEGAAESPDLSPLLNVEAEFWIGGLRFDKDHPIPEGMAIPNGTPIVCRIVWDAKDLPAEGFLGGERLEVELFRIPDLTVSNRVYGVDVDGRHLGKLYLFYDMDTGAYKLRMVFSEDMREMDLHSMTGRIRHEGVLNSPGYLDGITVLQIPAGSIQVMTAGEASAVEATASQASPMTASEASASQASPMTASEATASRASPVTASEANASRASPVTASEASASRASPVTASEATASRASPVTASEASASRASPVTASEASASRASPVTASEASASRASPVTASEATASRASPVTASEATASRASPVTASEASASEAMAMTASAATAYRASPATVLEASGAEATPTKANQATAGQALPIIANGTAAQALAENKVRTAADRISPPEPSNQPGLPSLEALLERVRRPYRMMESQVPLAVIEKSDGEGSQAVAGAMPKTGQSPIGAWASLFWIACIGLSFICFIGRRREGGLAAGDVRSGEAPVSAGPERADKERTGNRRAVSRSPGETERKT